MISRRSILRGALTVSTVAALPAFAGGHGRIGKFQGASNHKTTGRAELVKSGSGGSVQLLGDFTFDGAPDPKVALGNNGFDPKTIMGSLKSNNGASSYTIPAGINPDDYNEVWIWCEKFNVPLGVARL
ncbi:DM13 domain-containing protein [Litoreibacter arenae]|uniref:DM13 domain-containing protein n=1 Tax=Litoreibacter arenae TaxID=491388 RepID=UPI0005946E94|nr:DM13 domain-containing protein [Litoreibacter arenae]